MSKEKILQDRQLELFCRKTARTAASYLRRLEERDNTPGQVGPFFRLLENIFVNMGGVYPGRKKAGILCAMAPEELIYAAGAVPVRLCPGSYTAYSIGDEYMPRDACPLVKSVMGYERLRVSRLYEDCGLLVVPVTCDCKKKTAGLLSEIKPVMALQVPLDKESDLAADIYMSELRRLIPALEKMTGRQITAASLEEAVCRLGAEQYELSRFLEYRRHLIICGIPALCTFWTCEKLIRSGKQVWNIYSSYHWSAALCLWGRHDTITADMVI